MIRGPGGAGKRRGQGAGKRRGPGGGIRTRRCTRRTGDRKKIF